MQRNEQPNRRIRVVLADSQPKVRFALRVLLERRCDVRVVGEAADRDELLTLVSHLSPDLVLLSWGSPNLADDDLPRTVASVAPDACLIVLSEKPGLAPAAMESGAKSFVYKGDPPEELLAALDRCLIADRDSCRRDDTVPQGNC